MYRWILVGGVGAIAAVLTWWGAALTTSDFAQTWAAGRFLLAGTNPYDAIGPGREFEWRWPYFYPLTAPVAMLPLALAPLRVAEVLFSAMGAGLLAWILTRHSVRNPQLWVFTSLAFVAGGLRVQWSPVLIAAALLPSFGFLLATKPTIGAALLLAYPSRRAIVGATLFGLLTVVMWPWWVPAWLTTNAAGAPHFIAPVMLPGGVLLLLALLKWRRPEARLLAALACIPHTITLYDSIPLFLAVRRSWEGVALSALTYVTYAMLPDTDNLLTPAAATRHLWFMYVPCLTFILGRPNVAPAGDGFTALVDFLRAGANRTNLASSTKRVETTT